MKRILLLAIVFIVSMNLSLSGPTSFANGNDNDSSTLIKELVVLPEGSYNKVEANAMMKRLSSIPPVLLQELRDHGVKIKLVNGKITDEPEFAEYKGITPRGWEGTGLTWDDVPGVSSNVVIARIGYSNKGKGHNGQNLELHETFHAIDRIVLDEISSSSAFLDIWRQEARIDYDRDGYISTYPAEYFAETATLYFYSEKTQKRLKDKMPLTFKFLDQLFT